MKPLSAGTERLVAIDVIRVVAVLLVVTLHAEPFRDLSYQINFVVTNGVARLAVPLFLITSGYFIASTMSSGRMKPWVLRVLKLYVLWMMVYAPFWVPGLLDRENEAVFLARTLVIGYYHLWFLIALALAGLVLFCLITLEKDRWLPGLVVATLGAGIVLQVFHFHAPDSPGVAAIGGLHLNRSFLTFAFPYVAIGYLIATRPDFSAFLRRHGAFLLLAGGAVLAAEVWFNGHYAVRTRLSDNLVSVAILAPTIFALVANARFSLGQSGRILAPLSLAIYLVHVVILNPLNSWTTLGSMEVWALTCVLSVAMGLVLVHPKSALRWAVS
jgi:surface polysaccharide O-acyltransferase-like enzyme